MLLKAAVSNELSGMRLDDAIKILFPELSKTFIKKLIDWGGCSIFDRMCRISSRKVSAGDEITIGIMEPEKYVDIELEQNEIIFEDEDILSINKRSGISSQRTHYQLKGTIEYMVSSHFKKNGILEPVRIVHRLDKGTSGVMVFPKNKKTAAFLSEIFRKSEVEKVYHALISRKPTEDFWESQEPLVKVTGEGRYRASEGGLSAKTVFKVIARNGDGALIEARPITGRSHQIRVHLAHAGYPIVGDKTYGGLSAQRLMLHAAKLSFKKKCGDGLVITAQLDEMFKTMMRGMNLA